MSGKLNQLTLKQVLTGLRNKKFSRAELYQDIFESIATNNGELNAYLTFAKKIDDLKLPKKVDGLELLGAPLAVKDNYLTVDFPTTAASKVLQDYRPHYESTVTSKLRQVGAAILGKTNLDAWAHGSSTETSDFGPSKNPRNLAYMPGGSSGGSAVAVAANLCPAAIGTETAGSIRQPSAWCGVVGLKPTYGRVSRYGVIAMGSSLDSPGPITKTVEDAAILLKYMAGIDKYDSTSSPEPVADYPSYLGKSIKGLKIGLMYSDLPELKEIWPIYEKAFSLLTELGATVEPVQAMDPSYAIPMYAVIQRAEVSSNLARYDGIRYGQDRSFFGEEGKRRIMIGTYTLSKGYAEKIYVQAQKVRTLFIKDFERLFEKYDVLATPTSPGFPLKLGESAKYPYFGELMDKLLEPSSMSGLPGINVPIYFDPTTNLPLGMNLIGPAFTEGKLLQVAYAYEQAAGINEWLKNEL